MFKYFCMLFILLCTVTAFAAPMMPMPKTDIEGEISSISWNDEVHAKGVWGMSGSLGGDRVFPAHYRIELIDCIVTISEGEDDFGNITTGQHENYSISINHSSDDGYLKQGMRIKVYGYHRSGDEGGIWTNFDRVEILSCEAENEALEEISD